MKKLIFPFILLILTFSNIQGQVKPELRVQIGHTEHISDIVILPDGKTFLTASWDNTLKHWDLESGKTLNTFKGHTGVISELLLLPDGKTFLTGSRDKTIKHWDLKSGKELHTFKGHTDNIKEILLLPNAKTFLTESKDNTIKHWDIASGRELHTFKDSWSPILLPDGKTFLTASWDETVKHWDLVSGKEIKSFEGHTGVISELLLLPNGKTFLTGSSDSTIGHWDLESGKEIKTFKGHTVWVWKILLLPDAKTFLAQSADGLVKHWDLASGKEINTFKCGMPVLLPDGKTFLTKDFSKVEHWNIVSGKTLNTFKGHTGVISELLLLPDGKTFLTSARFDNRVKHWDLESGKELHTFRGHTASFDETLLLPDGKTFLINSRGDSTVKHWDLISGKVLHTFKGHTSMIWEFLLLPDGKTFLTHCGFNFDEDFTIKHWDLKSGKALNTFKGHTDNIEEVLLLPDAKTFLTGSDDGTIKHWDIASGKELHTFKGHTGHITKILLLPDAKTFLTESKDNTIKHWDLASGRELHTFKGYTGGISELLLLPDGKTFLTGSSDNTIKHWDLESVRELHTFKGHTDNIKEILLLPNAKTFLTGSDDNTIKHWDIASGKEIKSFEGHTGSVWEILLLPNAKTLLSRSENTIKHWDVESGRELGTFQSNYGNIYYGIHFLKDSTRFITGNTQNSLTLWDLKNYREICTFIPKAGNNKDFVIVSPDGYYSATKGAVNDLVHYVIGNKIYLFDQFDIRYNRPDIVLERIGLAPKELIETYRKAYIKRLKKAGFSEERIQFFLNGEFDKDFNAPEIFRKGKGYFYEQKSPQFDINFRAEDQKYNLDRLNITVNGVPLYGRKGIDLLKKKSKRTKQKLSIPLSEGENVIEISALNVQGVESLKDRFEVEYTPTKIAKPNLHLITIGVSKYQESEMNLNYPKKDTEDLIQVFESQKENYNKIITYQLTNEEATIENILKIKKELLKTNIEDKVIIFYAGHGVLDKDLDYYLATYDMNFANPKDKGLLYDDLENLLDGIPARQKILFMDACHSGEIDKDEVKLVTAKNTEKGKVKFREAGQYTTESKTTGLNNSFELMRETFTDLRKGTGSTVIASAGGVEVAWESEDYQNGVFTYCLLTGLKDKKADLNKDGKVMLSELQNYLQKAVPELTKGTQQPTSRIENLENDFVVW